MRRLPTYHQEPPLKYVYKVPCLIFDVAWCVYDDRQEAIWESVMCDI